eukprot:TRINITY_DN404_c0_g1_i1.p1 TRINITY_DN404_c0_g1~~TRINITY_DN404_c0_g1_i1.p1  ORF type:complete len:147 (+),score=24.97 TRINITY_DN404_c0_g1_i1:139-579(+)
MKGFLCIVVLSALVAFAFADKPKEQRYELEIYGGVGGKPAYPFDRELRGVPFIGQRAELWLWYHGKPAGTIKFVEREYLLESRQAEFKVEEGAQYSIQPADSINTFIDLIKCGVFLEVVWVGDCVGDFNVKDGYSVVRSITEAHHH